MVKKILLIFLIFLCASCSISIKGSFRGLYSYYKTTKKESPDLLVKADTIQSICDLKQSTPSKVYVINAEQLKKCIGQYDKAAVFIWNINCKGSYCYSPDLLQQYCNDKNIELFIVAKYYDSKPMQFKYNIERPIFGIDIKYYRSSLTSKYLSKFTEELTASKDILGGFMYFEKGIFKDSFKDIKALNSISSGQSAQNHI